jgi:maltose phosphorylase
MAGTWMSVVKGFGGMRVKQDTLHFTPFIPDQWTSYSFRVEFRGRVRKVKVSKDGVETRLESGAPLEITVNGAAVSLQLDK